MYLCSVLECYQCIHNLDIRDLRLQYLFKPLATNPVKSEILNRNGAAVTLYIFPCKRYVVARVKTGALHTPLASLWLPPIFLHQSQTPGPGRCCW